VPGLTPAVVEPDAADVDRRLLGVVALLRSPTWRCFYRVSTPRAGGRCGDRHHGAERVAGVGDGS
jgi:hypothetical protein